MKNFTIFQFIKSCTAFDLQGFGRVKKLTLKILFLAIGVIFTTTVTNAQSVWTSRTSAANNMWRSITFGNNLFVAVASTGTGNRVMTSPDGITWTIRTSAADNEWRSVTYGNGLFVAVANTGTNNRVMTSPDGINWTIRTSVNNEWQSVTYGNNLFVAVSNFGFGATSTKRVMTSPDGITWTFRTTPANEWVSVTYGNNLFVAVSTSFTGNLVMTSPDGITWTSRTPAAGNAWQSVTYGNNLFVAVAISGTGNRVMTSPDGINWTIRSYAVDKSWASVTYGNNSFVAVTGDGTTSNGVMTSPDGITWTGRNAASTNLWSGVTYGNNIFVAVAGAGGTNNRVMTSAATTLPIELIRFAGRRTSQSNILEWETASENTNKGFDIERSTDGIRFEKIGFVAGYGTTSQRKQYNYEDRINIGIVYYRLKQLDYDSRFEYSTIIVINTKLSPQLTIYPNPVKDVVTISGAVAGTKAILTDISGKVLQQINVAATSFTIDMSKYSSGIYLLKTQEGITQKIIKE